MARPIRPTAHRYNKHMRKVFVLEEILAILHAIGAPKRVIDGFRERATEIAGLRSDRQVDDVTVGSGYGADSQRGFVLLTLNAEQTQMDVRKAREIGLMLLECAEAAASDEIVMQLLEKVGINELPMRANILLELRAIRQGSREIVRAS